MNSNNSDLRDRHKMRISYDPFENSKRSGSDGALSPIDRAQIKAQKLQGKVAQSLNKTLESLNITSPKSMISLD